ncbi:MAG: alanine--tRNA ligase [Desulfovibrionaceae bacterium]|nr:alanine--tRNA ligase [Desulfovibrionaceae bacterium]
MLTTAEIRAKFLAFFKSKNHAILPSSSLIPNNDPTLLFTNAGMVQFKNIFQGKEKPLVETAATVQKCIRAGGKHNDLDNVGRTARHHTFFEMLGNFSFGSYFKRDAIRYAWEFITKELQLDKNRLYVTVYLDDDEAYTIWHDECGLDATRIFRLGEKDNFWTMGDTGPCGPSSEIFVDQGEALRCGDECGIGKCDCDRFLEIWNLVFMQFDQQADGTRLPLPKPSIDTGIGLERLAAICQGVHSNYDTDIFMGIIHYIEELIERRYTYKGGNESFDVAMRVIADHSRAIAFMIADGILPSNEGRGYVLRRILRRAYRFGRELGCTGTFLYKVVLFITQHMGEQYQELLQNPDFMQRIVEKEEEAFNKTLDKGLLLLEEMLAEAKEKKHDRLCGKKAFLLHDTYGFPIDIVNDIVEQNGMTVDLIEFEACIQEQKERARMAWKGGDTTVLQSIFTYTSDIEQTHFVGYEQTTAEALIQQLYSDTGTPIDTLEEGSYGYCVLTQTPFYATAGGQESDIGILSTENACAECIGAELSPSGAIVHSIYVTSGIIHKNSSVQACIDIDTRHALARNHTATHLAFAALRSLISPTIRQAGSLVTATKLRFDYTAIEPLTQEQINSIEKEVNTRIQQAISAHVIETEYEKAIAQGAVSLAGETYSDTVRVVSFDTYSQELCCGTHVHNTGEIGAFVITSESGVATGVRRIEAITGMQALTYMQEQRATLQDIALTLKCPQSSIERNIGLLIEEKKALQKQLEEQSILLASYTAQKLTQQIEHMSACSLLMHIFHDTTPQFMKAVIDTLRPTFTKGVIVLASLSVDTVHVVIYTGDEIVKQYSAKMLLEHIASYINAKGGGKPNLVQAGGKNPAGIEEAFSAIKTLLQ